MRLSITDQSLHAAFEPQKESPSFAESAELVRRGGRPVEMLQAFAHHPPLLNAFSALGSAVYPGGVLERELKEWVILEASVTNACQFCADSHVAIMRQLGIATDPIARLSEQSHLTHRQRLALDYTRAAMRDSNAIPDGLFAELRKAFSSQEIVELTFVIGLINALNLFNNCLQNRYKGEYAAPGNSSQ